MGNNLVIEKEKLSNGPWDKDIEEYPYHGETEEERKEKYEWIDEETEYKCSIKRNMYWNWLGYVELPKNHPYYDKNYVDIEQNFNVHGGLTYGENGKFGFDSGHLEDLSPGKIYMDHQMNDELTRFRNMYNRVASYRDYDYVKKEVKKLALQFYECQDIVTDNH